MRTWGITDGEYYAVDTVKLKKVPKKKNEIRYESAVFKCRPDGRIKDWTVLEVQSYTKDKEVKDGHNELVNRWIQAVIGTMGE